MLITRRKRRENKDLHIYLSCKKLDQVDKIRYLGIVLDKRFTFNEHITYTLEKCTTLVNSLYRTAKINWGLNHKALTTIYKGAILPLLSYGAPIWSNALAKNYNLRKLKRVQRLINIRIARSFRTASYEALCIVTGLTPIAFKIQEVVRLHHVKRTNRYGDLSVDHNTPYEKWTHPAERVEIKNAKDYTKYMYEIYTDGSKSDFGVGAGIVVFCNDEINNKLQFKLSSGCSNNQAEQLAIVKAIDYINTLNDTTQIEGRSVAIYTDSKITLDSLKNGHNHNTLIDDIRRNLKLLEKDGWQVDFSWVKAHIGNYGNEMADRLAKQAASDSDLQISYDSIPISAVKNKLAAISEDSWRAEWESSTTGLLTKSFFPTVQDRLNTKLWLTPNLTTLLTGHGRINYYFHRFKIKDSACRVCVWGWGPNSRPRNIRL